MWVNLIPSVKGLKSENEVFKEEMNKCVRYICIDLICFSHYVLWLHTLHILYINHYKYSIGILPMGSVTIDARHCTVFSRDTYIHVCDLGILCEVA